MSLLLGASIVTTVAVLYLGKKGWQALHKAVGITPGVVMYQDLQTPILLSDTTWRQLKLNKQYLSCLSALQLHQLRRIDQKAAIYHNHQTDLEAQKTTAMVSESHFVLHKMLYTRLPEMLASHYRLVSSRMSTDIIDNEKQAEASELLQESFNTIETRLDELLVQVEATHLQELRVMKHYIDSHNT